MAWGIFVARNIPNRCSGRAAFHPNKCGRPFGSSKHELGDCESLSLDPYPQATTQRPNPGERVSGLRFRQFTVRTL
jgi:hypothetical protein